MGVVYKGRDPFIDRIVAIKTIAAGEFGGDDDLLARLRMEAKSAGRLTHPNIVTVFEFGEQEGLAYLVMEYVEGANLANVISSKVHIALNTKLEIIIQLADGIAYAHNLGVIHRDIKPSNVCLTLRGDPKILDFGLARFDQTRLTKTGLTSGTLMYMSPERMKGESGPSDDIFALGAVAYEILTGRRAFPGDGYRDTVRNIMSGDYPIPPSKVVDVPSDLDAVIARATAIEKGKRYQSAADFAKALRDVQQSQTFRRRAVLDASNLQDSMNTVAIQFSMQNPYTAPDIAPTGTDIKRPAAPLPETATVQRVVDEPATAQHAVRQQTIEQLAKSQQQPTVAMTSPDFGAAAAMAPTEAMTAPRIPIRSTPVQDAAAMAPTEAMDSPAIRAPKADGGDDTFIGRTRTVVARAFNRISSGATKAPRSGPTAANVKAGVAEAGKKAQKALTEALPTPRAAKTAFQKAMLYGGAAGIAIAMGAAATAAANGPIALVSVYAGAIAAWYIMLRNCGRLGGVQAAAIGIAVTMVALVQGGLDSPQLAAELEAGRLVAAQGDAAALTVPPFASILFAGWSAIGGAPLYRAILGLIAILGAGWLLWDREKPQRALGVMTFPLLLVQGIVYARIEAVAAMLLVCATVATWRRRYGVAAFLGVIAAGTTTTAIAALPVLYGAAWYMIVFLSAGAVTLIVPKLLWPTSTAWSTSLTTLAATSPVLAFLNSRVAALLKEWGVIDVMNAFSNAITTRAGTSPRLVVAEVLATLILVVALFVAISIMAARAPGLDAAMADGIGLLLVLCMVREPAAWLLVAPFALLGNRLLWLLVAICSPILLFAPPDPNGAMIVWAISLGVPFAVWLAIRMTRRVAVMPEAPPLPS